MYSPVPGHVGGGQLGRFRARRVLFQKRHSGEAWPGAPRAKPYQKPCSGRKSRRGQTVQSHEQLRSDGLVGQAEAQYHHVGGNRIGGSGGGGGCVGRDESRRFFLGFLRLC